MEQIGFFPILMTLKLQVPGPCWLPWLVCSRFPQRQSRVPHFCPQAVAWLWRASLLSRGLAGYTRMDLLIHLALLKLSLKIRFLLLPSQKQFRNNQNPRPWCLCLPPLCSLSKQRPHVLVDNITIKWALLDSRWISNVTEWQLWLAWKSSVLFWAENLGSCNAW